jgi:sugar/nucleoside kinase (ribokinase family)
MEVMCLGILVADIVSKPVDRMPPKGTLALLDNMELHTGGCAANTGCVLARLGIKPGVMGKVGSDLYGEFIISRMKDQGLDVRGINRDISLHTSTTQVMVDGTGERTFLHYTGANGTLRKQDLDLELLKEAKVLHLAGTFLMPGFDGEQTVEVLREAKAKGLTVSLDTVWDASDRWAEIIQPYFKYVDIFLPSIEEAKKITGREEPGDIADTLLSWGAGTVGLKRGREGCYLKTGNAECSIPAFEVKVVDTTGAGDAFVAGFLYGTVKGWALEKTGIFANAVGGLCTTAMGATDGIRDFEGTVEFITQHGGDG